MYLYAMYIHGIYMYMQKAICIYMYMPCMYMYAARHGYMPCIYMYMLCI